MGVTVAVMGSSAALLLPRVDEVALLEEDVSTPEALLACPTMRAARVAGILKTGGLGFESDVATAGKGTRTSVVGTAMRQGTEAGCAASPD